MYRRHPLTLLALAVSLNACDDGGGSTPATDAAPMADQGTPDASPDGGACNPGAQGCPCAEGDTCNAGLICTDGTCISDGACTPGTLGCACAAGDQCGAGLACDAGTCVEAPLPTEGLRVQGGMAFGCEALFREGATPAAAVGFAGDVQGAFMRRDGKLALSAVSTGGLPLLTLGGIALQGGATATAADLELLQSRCFDGNGRALDGVTVVLD
ncbi:MAG: hypothetical protein KC613_01750 [Myxococcales bacterium]|nr:hypothetical protein [Myxococcales bacterium]MCB9526523.1 hypothetical protein [Myxococcales bacterium]